MEIQITVKPLITLNKKLILAVSQHLARELRMPEQTKIFNSL